MVEADPIAGVREAGRSRPPALIAGYKCRRSVQFHTEPLPLSGAGKILKTELRKPYWPQDGRAIN